jgi:hypothetical protein
MLEKAENAQNIGMAMQIIERAAKEMGDMYVNKGRTQPAGATRPTSVAVTSGVPNAPEYVLQRDRA